MVQRKDKKRVYKQGANCRDDLFLQALNCSLIYIYHYVMMYLKN